jgi:hypothetical protein
MTVAKLDCPENAAASLLICAFTPGNFHPLYVERPSSIPLLILYGLFELKTDFAVITCFVPRHSSYLETGFNSASDEPHVSWILEPLRQFKLQMAFVFQGLIVTPIDFA